MFKRLVRIQNSIYVDLQVLFVNTITKLSYATESFHSKTRACVSGVKRTLCSFLVGDEIEFCLSPKMSCTSFEQHLSQLCGVKLNTFAVYCQRVIDSYLNHVQASQPPYFSFATERRRYQRIRVSTLTFFTDNCKELLSHYM